MSPRNALRTEGPREASCADALEAFAAARAERLDEFGRAGLLAAIEIIGSFVDEVAPDLLDDVSRRRLARRAGSGPPRGALDARRLAPLLAGCGRCFPFQIVAGAGVVASFRAETPRLVQWLRANGHADDEGVARFAGGWAAAEPDLARHAALQSRIEDDLDQPWRALGEETIVGRFKVARVGPLGMWLDAGSGPRGPVRLPPATEGIFAAGLEVSAAFARCPLGFALLAAALPCPPGHVDALFETIR